MTEAESKDYLFDTSAIFALLEDEPGADRVEELLRTGRVYMPFVIGLEMFYITCQELSRDDAQQRLALLRQLPAVWLDQVTEVVVVTAGVLKALHHLSLADALIAAYAKEIGAILVHKDPEYDALSSIVMQERLPLKGSTRA